MSDTDQPSIPALRAAQEIYEEKLYPPCATVAGIARIIDDKAGLPDLLAACKAAVQFMEMIGNPAPPHPWMLLRDAIARAEGASA